MTVKDKQSYFDEAYAAIERVKDWAGDNPDRMLDVNTIAKFIDDTQTLMTGVKRRCSGSNSPLDGK
jgi:hypothetical protein